MPIHRPWPEQIKEQRPGVAPASWHLSKGWLNIFSGNTCAADPDKHLAEVLSLGLASASRSVPWISPKDASPSCGCSRPKWPDTLVLVCEKSWSVKVSTAMILILLVHCTATKVWNDKNDPTAAFSPQCSACDSVEASLPELPYDSGQGVRSSRLYLGFLKCWFDLWRQKQSIAELADH